MRGKTVGVAGSCRLIRRGNVLDGFDVPNGQDGVPGVTQAPVLPGQELVYRFRADQAGTYWYHTHSVSDIGVRMGLYGVLVVHTLAGLPVPVPRTASVDPGVPVRLRLLNTDSTTHRYALTGATFRSPRSTDSTFKAQGRLWTLPS